MTDLKDTYKQAADLFPTKSAKESRETSVDTSDFIREYFLPEVQSNVMETVDKLFPESKKTAKQRLRDYLGDTVSEFVDTNCLTGEEFFEILLECVYQNWDYYQRNADRNRKLLDLLQCKQNQETVDYQEK